MPAAPGAKVFDVPLLFNVLFDVFVDALLDPPRRLALEPVFAGSAPEVVVAGAHPGGGKFTGSPAAGDAPAVPAVAAEDRPALLRLRESRVLADASSAEASAAALFDAAAFTAARAAPFKEASHNPSPTSEVPLDDAPVAGASSEEAKAVPLAVVGGAAVCAPDDALLAAANCPPPPDCPPPPSIARMIASAIVSGDAEACEAASLDAGSLDADGLDAD